MTTKRIDMTSGAASTNGLAAGVSGATFVLTANAPADGLAHLITIKNNTANTHAGKTMAVVGTDENGNAQNETIAGPAGTSTVTTTKFFKTVTSITPSATIGADTFDLGWAVTSRGAWFEPNTYISFPFAVGIGCTVSSGTPTYAVKYTYDRSAWFTHATITAKTASFDGSVTAPCAAMCVEFAAAGGVVATFIQAAAR